MDLKPLLGVRTGFRSAPLVAFTSAVRSARARSLAESAASDRDKLRSRESDPASFASVRSVSRAATCAYRITRLIIGRHWTPSASHCKRLVLYMRHGTYCDRLDLTVTIIRDYSESGIISGIMGVTNIRDLAFDLHRVTVSCGTRMNPREQRLLSTDPISQSFERASISSLVDKFLSRPRFVNKHGEHYKTAEGKREKEAGRRRRSIGGKGGTPCGIERRFRRGARKTAWDEERGARLLGLFAVIGGALTR